MNYKVGDEVICIYGMTIYRKTALVSGNKYVVAFLDKACVAVEGVVPVEPVTNMFCGVCGNETTLAHFFPSRFIKLEPPAIKARTEPALVEAE